MNIINALKTAGAFAIFFVAAFLAPHDADAKSADQFTIPVIGVTDDGKYKVYDLEGDYEDIKWFTNSTNSVYSGNDLLTRLNFVDKADIDKGTYKCGFICKDKKGRTMGQPYWNKNYINHK